MIFNQQGYVNTGSSIMFPASRLSIQPTCHSTRRVCGLNLFEPRINCCETSFAPMSNHINNSFRPSNYVRPCATNFRYIARSMSIALLIWSSFHLSFLEPVYASEEIVVPACIAEKCGIELSSCFADQKCAEGVKCFMKCAAQDSFGINDKGLCQAKCYDLHEAPMLNTFSDCILTKNHCIDPLDADKRYPPLPRNFADERLSENFQKTENELRKLFSGTWYISAGLNPAYDTFDCQIHNFYKSKDENESNHIIADADFNYFIPIDKSGKKSMAGFHTVGRRLELVKNSDENDCNHRYLFSGKKKWGIDDFESYTLDEREIGPSFHLKLSLRPYQLNYNDEWTILSYSNDASNGYFVVAYKGSNSATKGYGGLNVYTRQPIDVKELLLSNDSMSKSDRLMLHHIQKALSKLNLSLQDLTAVKDNVSCKASD